MGKISQKIYCAFCRLERNICGKKDIDWTNVVLALLASFLMMFVVWQAWDARFVIFFVLFLAASEVFVRLRWRMSLPCSHCGFDPLLYKIDRQETVRRVKSHLDNLRASGRYLLKSQSPFAHLPTRKPDAPVDQPSPSNKNTSRLLSRQV